ncbi:hypothetical protein DV735_g580, partial [Chaetothyriales sp. CBS 134920]
MFLAENDSRRGGMDLAHCVAAKSSDIDLWSAVYNLITSIGPSTTPWSSLAPTFQATPVKTSSKNTTGGNGRKIPNQSGRRVGLELAWLAGIEGVTRRAPYKLYTTQSAYQFQEGKGRMGIFFQALSDTPEFKRVRVAGEHKTSHKTGRFMADLLEPTRYGRSIFYDQPTRRFVHAFTLCGSMMELWAFDRSGAYSSGPFDIHDEPDSQ